MHSFVGYAADGRSALAELRGAYALGADGVPLRAEVSVVDGQIRCETRTELPVALSLLWPVSSFGTVHLETTRLPVRDQPYLLHTELARHRLMRITLKREEWGLFDYPGMEEIAGAINHARDLFLECLEQDDDPRRAAELADESLAKAMWASERMCGFHASVFLSRRRHAGGFTRPFLGVSVPSATAKVSLARRLPEAFDFVSVPFVWRDIQPKEHGTHYETVDAWVKACRTAKLALRGGPLLNFGVRSVPDWMYIWENDYEAILDFAREHVRRIVRRYGDKVNTWIVASGLHADNAFSFNFEQIVELTRMAAGVTKDVAPRCQVILDLTQPWGEYYARNQRTIPPLLYADMAVQSGIPFDAFGLQFLFGLGSQGYHLRDMLQISAMIDRLANLGKPIHITAVAVPSAPGTDGDGGQWHGPWSDETQADWLAAFIEIALSKPYVESVCLDTLADGLADTIPHTGVLRDDLSPKPAFSRLAELRSRLKSPTAR